MDLNGKATNGVLGKILACREQIARARQTGHTDGNEWLLKRVTPIENQATLIGFITPLVGWAKSLTKEQREVWLVWAMRNRRDAIHSWLGYNKDWTMMPAVCKGSKNLVRITRNSGMPELYLIPGNPRNPELATQIELANGYKALGIELRATTYVQFQEKWYRVYYPKYPSDSAVNRALRLYVLGALVGRILTSTKDLWVYEMAGIKTWALHGFTHTVEDVVKDDAKYALDRLVIDPDLVKKLPKLGF